MSGARAQPLIDAFPIGLTPPLGVTPRHMRAWVIRSESHGAPSSAFREEIVPVPRVQVGEVLVLVKAAGVNFNGVWAALGRPISPLALHGEPYHVAGSDAAGVVWAVGEGVTRWSVGDEVVVHCCDVAGDDEQCNGGDPMLSPSQRIWGYETSNGSFAQFCKVKATQLLPRPQHLSWAASACYVLTLSTAYRMLFGHPPHTLGPGQTAFIWGAAGGLGSMAVQLANLVGARAIGVVSDKSRAEHVRRLGAAGTIDRSRFGLSENIPTSDDSAAYRAYIENLKELGREVRRQTGGSDVDLVFEHTGRATFAASCFLAKPGGMVVFCGATSGFDLTFDARYAWMRQKRIQGSHFASMRQAAEANRLMMSGKLDPCLSRIFSWSELPLAHQLMHENRHPPGNMAIVVQAPGEIG